MFQSSRKPFYDETFVGAAQYVDLDTDAFQGFLEKYVDYGGHDAMKFLSFVVEEFSSCFGGQETDCSGAFCFW